MENFNNEGFFDRPVNEKDIPWILEAWENQHANLLGYVTVDMTNVLQAL